MSKLESIQSSEAVCDAKGRQYHLRLAPGELAEYIILVGDPGRVEKANDVLKNIRIKQQNREFTTITGEYKGIEVSIVSTGIGPGSTEIAMIEAFQLCKHPTFIRVGTSGSLQDPINMGDHVISTGAVRLENTSSYFVPVSYPAIANYEVNLALISACENANLPYHLGLTATAPGFYGAQGRHVLDLPLQQPQIQEEMTKLNVANFEMEASTIFTLAQLKNYRASAICLAINSRIKKTFLSPIELETKEKECLLLGLEAFNNLARMDIKKAAQEKTYWGPEL